MYNSGLELKQGKIIALALNYPFNGYKKSA